MSMSARSGAAETVPLRPTQEDEDDEAGPPEYQKPVELTREEKMQKFMGDLTKALEDMPQNPVTENELEDVKWPSLISQALLNVVGFVLFALIGLLMEFKYMPKHVVLFLVFELMVYLAGVLLIAIAGELLFSKDNIGEWYDASPLLHAFRGKWTVQVVNKFEVFTLTHAVNKGHHGLRIDMVRVDDSGKQERVLNIRGVEISPSKFWIRSLWTSGSNPRDLLEKYRTKACLPCTWFDEELLDLKYERDFPLTAELQYRDRWRAASLHPAVNMVLSVLLAAVLSLPLVWLAYEVVTMSNSFCSGGAAAKGSWFAEMDSKEQDRLCSGIDHFVDAVNQHFCLSPIECASTSILVLVTLIVTAVQREKWLFQDRQDQFFCFSNQHPDGISQLRYTLALFSDFLNPFKVLACLVGLINSIHVSPEAMADLPFAKKVAPFNPAFTHILGVLRALTASCDDAKFSEMPLAIGERTGKRDTKGSRTHLISWEEKARYMQSQFDKWKIEFHLWEDPGRFKTVVIAPVTCIEALELFKNEFLNKRTREGGYNRQLNTIFSRPHAQDNVGEGQEGVTVYESFYMGPMLIPAGFALTHIAVFPEKQPFRSIRIGMPPQSSQKSSCRYVETRQALDELLTPQRQGIDPELDRMVEEMGCAYLDQFANEEKYSLYPLLLPAAKPVPARTYGRPPTTYARSASRVANASACPEGHMCYDSDDLHRIFGEDVVYSFSFVFQLAPQYYDQARSNTKELQHHPQSYYKVVEGFFRGMERRKLEQIKPKDPKDQERLNWLKKQSSANVMRQLSYFGIIVKERSVVVKRKIFKILQEVGLCWSLVLFWCLLFGFFVPLFRKIVDKVDAFPGAFFFPILGNSLMQSFALGLFLYLFESETQRLRLTNAALAKFEQKTMTPASHMNCEENHELDPFQLYVTEGDGYRPAEAGTDKTWKKRWTNIGQNVESWDTCGANMRVLVSTARLTAQAVITLAALILGIMMLMSFMQARNGVGMLDVDTKQITESTKSALHQGISMGNDALDSVKHELGKAVGDATSRRLDGLVAGATASGGVAAGVLVSAMDSLHEASAPFRASLHSALRRQLSALVAEHRSLSAYGVAKGYAKSVKGINLSKCTKTQALTMLFFALILGYAIRLVAHIASINDYVVRQEAVLVQTKSSHRKLQTGREIAGEKTEKRQKPKQGEGEQTSHGQDSDSSSSESDGGKPPGVLKDCALRRYEKMLDMAIENAKKNKQTFPLKLFGFVISYSMLLFWVGAAGTHLLGETVPILEKACNAIEHSRFMDSLQDQVDTATNVVNGAISSTEQEALGAGAGQEHTGSRLLRGLTDAAGGEAEGKGQRQLLKSMNLKSIFHKNVCKPLVTSAKQHLQELEEKVKKASETAGADDEDTSRRLGSPQARGSLSDAVLHWWAAHPQVPPEVKLTMVRELVDECKREAHRLLLVAPMAVRDFYHLHGLGPALDSVMLHWDVAKVTASGLHLDL